MVDEKNMNVFCAKQDLSGQLSALGLFDHLAGKRSQLLAAHLPAKELGFSLQILLKHLDGLILGKLLGEYHPVGATIGATSDDLRPLTIPAKQRDAIEERMSVALADVVVDGQAVGEADGFKIGVARRTGITKREIHVLLRIVGERTAREGGKCLGGHETQCTVHSLFVIYYSAE